MNPSQPPPRVDWLNSSTEQISESLDKKRQFQLNRSREMMQSLATLETHLLRCIQSVHNAEQNLMNGGDQCTAPFINNIQNYIDGLGAIGSLSTSLDGMTFPIALCGYIDEGKNPDLQMKQNYMVTQSRNNVQRARIINTNALEQHLKNGRKYYTKWTADIDQQSERRKKGVPEDSKVDDDEDIDIAMDSKAK